MALNLSLRSLVGISFALSLGVVAACGGGGSSSVDPKLAYSGVYVGAYSRADGVVTVSVANKSAEVSVTDSDAGSFLGTANISSNGHFQADAADPNDFNVPPVTITVDANATDGGNGRSQYNVAVTSGTFTMPAVPVTYVGSTLNTTFGGTYVGTFTGTKSGSVRFVVTFEGKMKALPVVDGTEVTGVNADVTSLRQSLPFTANGVDGSCVGTFRYVSGTNKQFSGTWTLGADSGTFTSTIVN
jgi:hypothetical protein